jgi:hypothetical protein
MANLFRASGTFNRMAWIRNFLCRGSLSRQYGATLLVVELVPIRYGSTKLPPSASMIATRFEQQLSLRGKSTNHLWIEMGGNPPTVFSTVYIEPVNFRPGAIEPACQHSLLLNLSVSDHLVLNWPSHCFKSLN